MRRNPSIGDLSTPFYHFDDEEMEQMQEEAMIMDSVMVDQSEGELEGME